MKKYILPVALLALTITSLNSCKKDDDTTKNYDVPTTYNFDSVDYSGQTARLDMIGELSAELKKGNTGGVVVEATVLNMYRNENNPFANTSLNTSGKQLKDKTIASERNTIEEYLKRQAVISQLGTVGADGVAGVVGTKYLCDTNGIEYAQLVEKGLYGSLIYYQIAEVYLSDSKIGASLAKSVRQHSWDEAFGYYGVPKDFPTNTTGIRYVGKYGNDRNALLNVNSTIMNAYIKGRAAINNDDNDEVTKQAAIVKETVEKVLAGTAVHYLNEAITGFGNDATRNHTLSEGIGFVKALKFNSSKKITDTQITEVLNKIGNNTWNVTQQNLIDAKNILSGVYGWDAIKDQL